MSGFFYIFQSHRTMKHNKKKHSQLVAAYYTTVNEFKFHSYRAEVFCAQTEFKVELLTCYPQSIDDCPVRFTACRMFARQKRERIKSMEILIVAAVLVNSRQLFLFYVNHRTQFCLQQAHSSPWIYAVIMFLSLSHFSLCTLLSVFLYFSFIVRSKCWHRRRQRQRRQANKRMKNYVKKCSAENS